jgi:hypothetical protein
VGVGPATVVGAGVVVVVVVIVVVGLVVGLVVGDAADWLVSVPP